MNILSDDALKRLQNAVDEPDLSGTNYRLLKRIGQGGMAAVYGVYDGRLERELAMKVLSLPDPDGELAARMLREARIVARLEHPGIVPIHDVGTLPDHRVFYVMKYVHGRRLDEQTPEAGLSDQLRLFQRICEPVAFAHSQGVIHRDLKPENIMVGAFGEVLVMDWGLAKAMRGQPVAGPGAGSGAASASVITQHGAVMGTPAYMAPEQAAGEIRSLNEQTDIYALGAILYFLLTGAPPVRSAEFTVTPPRQIENKIPRAVQAICLKAMARDPQLRYRSASDLAADVGRYLDGLPVQAYPENPLETIGRWMSRNYFLVILILTYLFMRTLLLYFTGR